MFGAEAGTRTPTPLRAHDPESCASANSATSARAASVIIRPRMPSQASASANDRTIATNRRAWHEYAVLETVEAGLALRGTEVKSLRADRKSTRLNSSHRC